MNIQETAAKVTGAASGLGAATAKRLADARTTVFGLDLQQSIERAGDNVPDGVTLLGTFNVMRLAAYAIAKTDTVGEQAPRSGRPLPLTPRSARRIRPTLSLIHI